MNTYAVRISKCAGNGMPHCNFKFRGILRNLFSKYSRWKTFKSACYGNPRNPKPALKPILGLFYKVFHREKVELNETFHVI